MAIARKLYFTNGRNNVKS